MNKEDVMAGALLLMSLIGFTVSISHWLGWSGGVFFVSVILFAYAVRIAS